ncbi:MAG: hypothetical protein QM256_10635 [Pseudomonadota bacterium]|jgi:hypothetical protein|nr:hypothetical protein [Syntrophaceae bacterium]MDI9556221.1 hypothetical protein [Pseudomonadota bacterium]NLX32327.1 hypothetical protein [Deltaproteobacteria bacterium]HNU84522.1 hypothetical protein [Syntrophales bacterium]HNZ34644.1 hypothetical protein [Syntrophales bacterium]
MRKGSRIGAFAVLAVAALVAVTAPAPCGAEVKGQRPMMIVEDVFQFTPGAWSDYLIHDRSKQEYYRMSIATLERLDRNGKPCSWMEIGVTPEKEPPVVTRLLVEQTKTGPGEIYEVIVQVRGYAPFTVPESFFRGEDKDVGNVKSTAVAKRIERRVIPVAGRSVRAWDVEAVDAAGDVTAALVSEEVAPIGVILAESPQVDMVLSDWGTGAKSKIEGTPVNFYVWLMMQMGDALTK